MSATAPAGSEGPAPLIIGTAGHVDHGKSTLIRALTGTDPDRLPEEKRRGLTIDLGFGHLRLPSGREAGIVDVPGHERFVKNMVAGASGMDLVLLVVAADEGVMPQTEEHLDILQLLGVRRGLLVVTKVDLVDREWLDLVDEEVREAVRGTFLEGAPLVHVSSLTGEGLEELLATVEQVAAGTPPRPATGPARLPVDRVFTMAGFGTVVTGTLASGRVRLEERLELLPSGRPLRVRGIQVHNRPVEEATAGHRVALNISLDRDEVVRGDVVATPGVFRASLGFSGHLELLGRLARPLANGARVRLHAGTRESLGRIVLLDRDELRPGERAPVYFRSETPLVVARGDRFVIRSYSPARAIGGGDVIDPVRRVRRGDRAGLERLERLARGDRVEVLRSFLDDPRPWSLEELARAVEARPAELGPLLEGLARRGEASQAAEGVWLGRNAEEALLERLAARLRQHLEANPLRHGLPREELRQALLPDLSPRAFGQLLERWAAGGRLRLRGELVQPAGWEPRLSPAAAGAAARVEEALRTRPFDPPDPQGLELPRGAPPLAEVLRYLQESGRIERAGTFWFHRSAVEEAVRRVREHFLREPRLTLAQLRDLLGTTRKYAVPLAERLDELGVTRRAGDDRVPGPAGGTRRSPSE
ncbi:MAG: selenocysteine-specific translation elongation factor [Bacillota bacterium]|nr:selenocysteine-specific translation elongation factor [Bacillota bacterium]